MIEAAEPISVATVASSGYPAPLSLGVRPGALCYLGFLERGRTRVEAERRQVAVLFADVVDFTSCSERSGRKRSSRLCEPVD